MDEIGQNDEGRVVDPRRDVEEGAKGEGTRGSEEEKWLRRTPMQVCCSHKTSIIIQLFFVTAGKLGPVVVLRRREATTGVGASGVLRVATVREVGLAQYFWSINIVC